MADDPVIEFAQLRFGSRTNGLVDPAVVLPEWLTGGIDERLALGENDAIKIEGNTQAAPGAGPTADGSTPDTLAYYIPFHFSRNAWGIYVRAYGVLALAQRIRRGTMTLETINAAYRLLVEHERLHFAAEYAASRIEVITATSCYREYFQDQSASSHEEALANARAIVGLRRHHPRFVAAAIAWMRTQPDGYGQFESCTPPHMVDAERRATTSMTAGRALVNHLAVGVHPAEFVFRRAPHRLVPTYWVFDRSRIPLRLARPFPKGFGLQVQVHSNDHKPPHIHILLPPGKERTRYRWPELTPLKGDPQLRAHERRNLDRYMAVHGAEIDARVRSIPWQ